MTQITARTRIIAPRNDQNIKSRYLPEDLNERYTEMAVRDGRLSVDDAIALLDVRETLLYEQLNKSAPDYEMLSGALADLRMAHNSRAKGEFDTAADLFSALLAQGVSAEEVWQKLEKVVLLRQRMVDSERRRLIQESTIISIDQARQIVSRMISAIDLCVRDEDLKSRIMKEFRRALQVDGSLRVVD